MSKTGLITVLMGGSNINDIEINHSIEYGNTVYNILSRDSYDVNLLLCTDDIVNEIYSSVNTKIFFNAIIGRYGEDGFLPSLFEAKRVSYTGSGAAASIAAMDKKISKLIFRSINIKTPKFQIIKYDLWLRNGKRILNKKEHQDFFENNQETPYVYYPVVVKPNRGSFSIGKSVVYDEKNFIEAMTKAASINNEIMIEEYIPGHDAHVPILNGKSLTPIEKIKRTKHNVFFNKFSFSVRNSSFIIPGDFPKCTASKLSKIAERVYSIFGCRGLCRADFRLSENNEIYILELNTQHSIREKSMALMSAAASGLTPVQLVNKIIENRWIPVE